MLYQIYNQCVERFPAEFQLTKLPPSAKFDEIINAATLLLEKLKNNNVSNKTRGQWHDQWDVHIQSIAILKDLEELKNAFQAILENIEKEFNFESGNNNNNNNNNNNFESDNYTLPQAPKISAKSIFVKATPSNFHKELSSENEEIDISFSNPMHQIMKIYQLYQKIEEKYLETLSSSSSSSRPNSNSTKPMLIKDLENREEIVNELKKFIIKTKFAHLQFRMDKSNFDKLYIIKDNMLNDDNQDEIKLIKQYAKILCKQFELVYPEYFDDSSTNNRQSSAPEELVIHYGYHKKESEKRDYQALYNQYLQLEKNYSKNINPNHSLILTTEMPNSSDRIVAALYQFTQAVNFSDLNGFLEGDEQEEMQLLKAQLLSLNPPVERKIYYKHLSNYANFIAQKLNPQQQTEQRYKNVADFTMSFTL